MKQVSVLLFKPTGKIIFFLALILMQAHGENMSQSPYTLPQDCDFIRSAVRDCAPQLARTDVTFTGVLINGPKSVIWPKNDSPDNYMKDPFGVMMEGPFRLYIAISYMFPYHTLGLNGDFENDILIVAVNQDTQQVYSGRLHKIGSKTRMPINPDPRAVESLKTTLSGGYFKFPMVEDLRLPIASATYTVYATLGEYKSNILTIKTVVE